MANASEQFTFDGRDGLRLKVLLNLSAYLIDQARLYRVVVCLAAVVGRSEESTRALLSGVSHTQ